MYKNEELSLKTLTDVTDKRKNYL